VLGQVPGDLKEELLEIADAWLFQTLFLSPNQQCESIEGITIDEH